MKKNKPGSVTSIPSQGRYEKSLREYHADLKTKERKDFCTMSLLAELEAALDRVLKLKTPYREAAFVEEVCRIGRRRTLAA
jgi:hypothetical protein